MDSLKGLAHDSTIEIHSQAEVTRYASSPMIAIGPTRAAAVAVIPARREKTFAFRSATRKFPLANHDGRRETRRGGTRVLQTASIVPRLTHDPPTHHRAWLLRRKAEISASIAADSRFVPPPAILSPSEKRPATASHEKTVTRAKNFSRAFAPRRTHLPPTRTRQGTGDEAQEARRDRKRERKRNPERNPGVRRGGQGERREARVQAARTRRRRRSQKRRVPLGGDDGAARVGGGVARAQKRQRKGSRAARVVWEEERARGARREKSSRGGHGGGERRRRGASRERKARRRKDESRVGVPRVASRRPGSGRHRDRPHLSRLGGEKGGALRVGREGEDARVHRARHRGGAVVARADHAERRQKKVGV